jgi:glycosyltransferase involved in cell wall biosynthesis
VGRFIATKRFPLLVEAFERLAEKRPKLVLMLLGDGGEAREEVLQRVASSVLRDRIYLKGHQSEPAPFYGAMDLMVMPSSHEGLANALLEAMACGVPVLAHEACGASEVVRDGETGYLREIESGEGLAGVIETIWGSEVDLEVVGRAARAAAVGELSIEGMVGSYLKLYRECVMG